MEIVHADVEQLRRILIECERPYNKIEKDMGYQLGSQERWMQMKGLVPIGSDAEIPDDMDPWLDLNVDWIQIRKTPAKKVKFHMLGFSNKIT